MKPILAVVTPFPEQSDVITGGVEGVAYHLTIGLERLDQYKIHIVAPCSNGKARVEERGNITVHWLKTPRIPGFLAYWSVYRQQIHHCLDAIKPNITHFQGVAGWTLGYKKPYVLTIHGFYEKDVLYTAGGLKKIRAKIIAIVERLGRSRAKNIISISPYVKQEIGSKIKGNVWDIENPIADLFFKAERNIVFGKILYIGRISQLKNILGLIRAFSNVHQQIPQVTLHLAGKSVPEEYQTACVKLINELGLEENVTFLGNLDRDLLVKEISTAACLALVSFQETAPMVIEEAMAVGIPVVASNLCGIPYMIREGKTGYLVNPVDNKNIAEKLYLCLRNEKKNIEMGNEARRVAQTRFHIDSVSRKTLAVYNEILRIQ